MYSGLGKQFCGASRKEKEEEVDRKRDGRTVLRSGEQWTLLPQLEQLRQDLVERIFYKAICGAPVASQWYGID